MFSIYGPALAHFNYQQHKLALCALRTNASRPLLPQTNTTCESTQQMSENVLPTIRF